MLEVPSAGCILMTMSDTLTIALNGDVPLRDFSTAMVHFHSLVEALSSEVAGDTKIEWTIDALESGSAVATVRGHSERAIAVSSVVTAYALVGKSLQFSRPMPYTERVKRPAVALTELLDNKITSLRFETPDEDIVIASHYIEGGIPEVNQPRYAFGAVKGIVETLSRRRGVRFTLYDTLFERPISCYLAEGEEDQIKDYWGKMVIVAGRIGRDAESGRPFAVRDISRIALIRSGQPGSYKNARGVLELDPGQTPEGVIRAVRDGD